jgi:hypothetical protein
MKEVVYTRQALLQFEESVKELVEQRYFSEELENVYSIVYLGNNQLIGHRLDIAL